MSTISRRFTRARIRRKSSGKNMSLTIIRGISGNGVMELFIGNREGFGGSQRSCSATVQVEVGALSSERGIPSSLLLRAADIRLLVGLVEGATKGFGELSVLC